jgi:hypothetical protein
MNIALFLSVLPRALLGWFGVFVVIGVIALVVALLQRFDRPQQK